MSYLEDKISSLAKLCEDTRRVCMPLQKEYGITFFSFHCFQWDDTLRTYWLCNRKDFCKYYFDNNLYLCSKNLPMFRNGGIFYLDHYLIPNPEVRSFPYLLHTMKERFDITHIVSVSYNFANTTKIYTFGVPTTEHNFNRIFDVNQKDFFRFINYFKSSSRHLLQKARFHCYPVNKSLNHNTVSKYNPVDIVKSAFNQLPIKRYYLEDEYEGIYLTPHEALCLQQLSSNSTYAQIAKQLNISRFTIKRHMDNIRTKLNVGTKNDLISIIKEKKILSLINNEFIGNVISD